MTNQNESQKLMLRESAAHKRMDDEFKEATKAVDALYAELDDLRAYKELVIELANRKGYDSLAGVFDDWEKHELRQQVMGITYATVDLASPHGAIPVDALREYAKQLRKKAEEL